MRRLAAVLALALAACSSAPTVDTPAPSAPAAAAPARPEPPRSTRPAVARDACGASELQGLVGRPRSEIPVPLDPGRQRVVCTSCPMTMDERPDRLNFLFDAETGVIRQVRCG